MVALYRPGPMEWIPDYINGKHKRKQVAYLHPKLEKILDKTYGVAIYQEQVMQIARDLAGFSMGQADVLRKAMGKKIPALLAEQKEKFIVGCVTNEVKKELAEKVFSFIEPFAGYGFNRSHAACYAMIGYQTAYLKAHYPAEFMAALLTSDQQDIDRIAIEVDECRKMGLKVMPPDINESFASFTVVTSNTALNQAIADREASHTIRFGLRAIKNVGENIANAIITERKANGPFADVFNFLERITDKDLNKKSLESLIKCGGLDSYGDRGQLLTNLELFLDFNKENGRLRDNKQNSLFFDTPSLYIATRPKLVENSEVSDNEKLQWEKELLGLYITKHPFNPVRLAIGDYALRLNDLKEHQNDVLVYTAGLITGIKKIITRAGQTMLFVKIEDGLTNAEVLVFPKLLAQTLDLWQEGTALILAGKVSDKDAETKVLVEVALKIDLDKIEDSVDAFKRSMVEFRGDPKNKFKLSGFNKNREYPKKPEGANKDSNNKSTGVGSGLPHKVIFHRILKAEELEELKNILVNASGDSPVYFKVQNNGEPQIVKTAFKVKNEITLKNRLQVAFPGALTIVEK